MSTCICPWQVSNGIGTPGLRVKSFRSRPRNFIVTLIDDIDPRIRRRITQTDIDADIDKTIGEAFYDFCGIIRIDGAPHRSDEGILYTEIDVRAIASAKASADPAGHYPRLDLTRLLIDRTKSRPVEEMAGHMKPA